QPQGIVQRQRMRHARLIEFRGHDPDIVRQRTRDLLDHLQARRVDAVVIGAKNSHACSRPFRSIPPSLGRGFIRLWLATQTRSKQRERYFPLYQPWLRLWYRWAFREFWITSPVGARRHRIIRRSI